MAERKQSEELAAKAALAMGEAAARRAVDGFLKSGAEDEAGEKDADPARSKSRRNKLIAFAVVGLLIVVGVIGMVVSYWHWFLLAGLLGLAGLYGWSRVRGRFRKKDVKDDETSALRVAAREDGGAARARADAAPARSRPTREEQHARARAEAEAEAIAAREVEDELEAMKARLRK
jgi:hypothetical protein